MRMRDDGDASLEVQEFCLCRGCEKFRVANSMILNDHPNSFLSRRGISSPPPILGGDRGGKISLHMNEIIL